MIMNPNFCELMLPAISTKLSLLADFSPLLADVNEVFGFPNKLRRLPPKPTGSTS